MLNLESEISKSIEKVVKGKKAHKLSDLLESLKNHDLDTYNHSIRVGELSKKALEAYTSKQFYLDYIFCAGISHDIGKLGISKEIINAVPFDDRCREIMDNHPEIGYQLLKDIDKEVALICEGHHTFQNRIYPAKLPGLNNLPTRKKYVISFFTMIITIVDAYDRIKYKSNNHNHIEGQLIDTHPQCKEMIQYLFKKEILKENKISPYI
ncbi:MAG: HD domain-containing protein [Candidatus Nanoarchaeia archaeon]|nr:HD domain-containing protein [Candidatus Nanoarchaeia archaeon]